VTWPCAGARSAGSSTAAKDSEATCATLGQSLTATKLAVFTLSAAMAEVAVSSSGPPRRWSAAPTSQMFESRLILAVVASGGASV
jgi:ABC-type branched-subunit amino acid transport system permease subunit